jgi:hypothetical protein
MSTGAAAAGAVLTRRIDHDPFRLVGRDRWHAALPDRQGPSPPGSSGGDDPAGAGPGSPGTSRIDPMERIPYDWSFVDIYKRLSIRGDETADDHPDAARLSSLP